jgi:hypothetical protein
MLNCQIINTFFFFYCANYFYLHIDTFYCLTHILSENKTLAGFVGLNITQI